MTLTPPSTGRHRDRYYDVSLRWNFVFNHHRWPARDGRRLQLLDRGELFSARTPPRSPRLTRSLSRQVTNLTVCVFVIGFGVGPMIMSPLSELLGRKLIYLISMALWTIFTIPCAVSKSIAVLIVFRFLAGFFASVPMCNAAGSIADVVSARAAPEVRAM